jgi:N utilization substance protein B
MHNSTTQTQFYPRKLLTRLAAVQTLYSWFICEPAGLFEQFLLKKITNINCPDNQDNNIYDISKLDYELLATLGRGFDNFYDEITSFTTGFLNKDMKFSKLELTLKIILFFAVFELKYSSTAGAKTIINDYVNLTAEFHEKKDIGFVNAILDRVARQVRHDEFESPIQSVL